MKMSRTVAIGSAVALLLAGCASTSGADKPTTVDGELPAGVSLNPEGGYVLERNEPVKGGSLRVALDAAVDTLDPLFLPAAGSNLIRAIYDPLLRFDETAQRVVGDLAESFETEDQGKTWTLKLPAGVKFHDGTDFNAEAVAAHFLRIGAADSTSGSAKDARNFTKIETPDPTTVVLTLAEPNPILATTIASPWSVLGIIPSPTAVAALGSNFGLNAVGTGPFMVESFLPGSDARVVRNPHYRTKGLPYLDAIDFVTATDNQSRMSAALAGDLDLAQTNNAADLQRVSDGGLLALPQVSYNYFNIVFNMSKPPFDDVRFRKAVIQAINLDILNDAVYGGLHEPMTGLLQKSNPFYVKTDWPTFNPDEAKQLIEDWQADTGNAPEFTIVSFAPTDFQKQAAIVQQMLADIGVTMNIEIGEQATMVSEAFAGNYTAQLRWMQVFPEVTQGLINSFHSESGLNIGHAGDAEVDDLLDQARQTTDPDERRNIYKQLQERFADWLPMIPLLEQVWGWYASDRVGGFPGTLPGFTGPDFRQIYLVD